MTTPDTTEDFTAANADPKSGSARWARRLPVRLPRPIPLRRRRSLETAPFDPASSPTVDVRPPPAGGRPELTHRLAGFDLRSVTSTALLYYSCVFVVFAVAVVFLWVVANMLGVVGRVEEFMRSIGFGDFRFIGFEMIVGGVMIGAAAVAFLTVMTVLAAALYNVLGRPDRGVKLSIVPIVPVGVEASSSHGGNGNGNGNGDGDGNGSETHNGENANGNGDGGESTRRRRFVRFRSLVGRQRAE